MVQIFSLPTWNESIEHLYEITVSALYATIQAYFLHRFTPFQIENDRSDIIQQITFFSCVKIQNTSRIIGRSHCTAVFMKYDLLK